MKVNGYSNQFFGWGGEDDDFSARCRRRGVQLVRYPKTIARYKMIHHDKDSGNEANPNRLVCDCCLSLFFTMISQFYISQFRTPIPKGSPGLSKDVRSVKNV